MKHEKLSIKLIKKEMENSIEELKMKQGDITQDQLYTIIYQTCRQLMNYDINIEFEKFFNDLEQLDNDRMKQYKQYLIKHKETIDDMYEEIKKL